MQKLCKREIKKLYIFLDSSKIFGRSYDLPIVRPYNPSVYCAVIIRKIERILCFYGFASKVELFFFQLLTTFGDTQA